MYIFASISCDLHMPKKWFQNWFNSPYYHILYHQRNDEEAEFFIDNLCAYLKPGADSNLLDIACGRGRHSVYLNKKGYDVTGIDLSVSNVKFAQQFENVDHVDFIAVDQLQFKVYVVEDGDFFLLGGGFYLVVDIEVFAFVILKLLLVHGQVSELKIGEAREDVAQAHQLAEGFDKV